MQFEVLKGDITKIKVDAIVNAANKALMGGSGVDGAIHRAAGPQLQEACTRIREASGGCETGHAVVTAGFKLPCRYIIHTVGPVYSKGNANQAGLLKSCYLNSVHAALARGCKTLAFPNISTGVYGYPAEKAADLVYQTFMEIRDATDYSALKKVVFVCFGQANYSLYCKKFNNGASGAK